MINRWLLASVHVLALGIGLGAIVVRASALRGELSGTALRRVFNADTAWGIAALLWISTGLLRAFAGFEKGSAYYLSNTWFWFKMALLVAILLLEAWPMTTLIRWRIGAGRGRAIETSRAVAMSRISMVQAVLVIAMVFAATAMARGFGT